MIRRMALIDGRLEIADQGGFPVWVYSAPTPDERRELDDQCDLDAHDINSALDPDEVARLEVDEGWTFLIWKRPKHLTASDTPVFEVGTEGVLIQTDRLTVIQPDDSALFEDRKARRYRSSNELVIRHLQQTVSHFVSHLRAIKRASSEIEVKLARSMENKYFLQMFSLSESLVYYIDALESNGNVLKRLAAQAAKLGFSEEEKELLDDVAIDNQQSQRQAEIYQSVLNGLMDARGNIINNNMNVLLKNLTIINIVFLPLNLIAGMGGMSEFTVMTQPLSWPVSYGLFTLAMVVIGVVLWKMLNKIIGRTQP